MIKRAKEQIQKSIGESCRLTLLICMYDRLFDGRQQQNRIFFLLRIAAIEIIIITTTILTIAIKHFVFVFGAWLLTRILIKIGQNHKIIAIR